MGASVWLVEAISLAAFEIPAPPRLGSALALGLAAVGVVGLVLGLMLDALARLYERARFLPSAAWPVVRSRVEAWFRDGDDNEQRRRAGMLLGGALCIVGDAIAARVLIERLIVGMARPDFAALAIVGVLAGLALATLALLLPFMAIGITLVRIAMRVPVVGPYLLATPGRCARTLGVCALLAAGAFAVWYRAPLSYLPFGSLARVTAGCLLGIALFFNWSRLPLARLTLFNRLAMIGAIACLVAASLLGATDAHAKRRTDELLLSGRGALAALALVLDPDHDGHLSLLAGGDCAPFDAAIHPGAIDTPGDGRDEDCDGADADLTALQLERPYHAIPPELPARPPVILITVDAFAASHMGSFGYERKVTPELDAFAARSALFRSCFSQGPSTRLSFPALFASRWDSEIEQQLEGRHPFPIGASEQLLAATMRDAGYQTAAVLSNRYFRGQNWPGLTRGFTRIVGDAISDAPHNAVAVTDAAIATLQSSTNQPPFLWVHYFDAHPPHDPPPGVPNFGDEPRDRYDAELHLVDRELGRLLRDVEERFHGQALVIVTGDHGIDFDEPRHERFQYGYDLSSAVLHVPLIVHAPFIPANGFDHVVSTLDIVPTLANLLRMPPSPRVHGASLVPELLTGKAQRVGPVFHQLFLLERRWHGDDPLTMVSVRTDRFNLIHDRIHDEYELYDYRSDPLEARDLSDDREYANTLVSLRRALNTFTLSVHHETGMQAGLAGSAR